MRKLPVVCLFFFQRLSIGRYFIELQNGEMANCEHTAYLAQTRTRRTVLPRTYHIWHYAMNKRKMELKIGSESKNGKMSRHIIVHLLIFDSSCSRVDSKSCRVFVMCMRHVRHTTFRTLVFCVAKQKQQRRRKKNLLDLMAFRLCICCAVLPQSDSVCVGCGAC